MPRTHTRWADLADLLADHTCTAYTLTLTGTTVRSVAEGTAGELMRTAAEHHAVVAPIRDDLDAFDLDGCAEQCRPEIVAAAAMVGGVVVYLAGSGSEDSEHLVIGTPNSAARAAFLDHVDLIRKWSGAGKRLDYRRGRGGGFRLPGSAPLKVGGGRVVPIDPDSGRALTPTEALDRARAALRVLEDDRHNATNDAPAPSTPRPPKKAASSEISPIPAPAPSLVRAWKPRRDFTDDELARLDTDGTRGDRSLTAVRAAWALWCAGVRSWSEAGDFYATRPAFAKFAARRDGGRAHWESLADNWASYRGEVDPVDQMLTELHLTTARGWVDHDLQAALVAVIVHRFLDGRGTVARPIACRDLAMWIGTQRQPAARRLASLVDRGVLEIARQHQDGPPEEATLYTLTPAVEALDVEGRTDLDPTVVLHRVWWELGQRARAVWSALTDEPATAETIASTAGLPLGDTKSGTRRQLVTLADHDLATRIGKGRGTRWTRGPADLDTVAKTLNVEAEAQALAEQINVERALWHATTAAERRAWSEALHRVSVGV